nr:ventricular zone-expressed PH domain-containing protein-like [Salvelinus alpinus]
MEGETDCGSTTPHTQIQQGRARKRNTERLRFNRSKSLAPHAVRSRSINSESGQDGEGVELTSDVFLSVSPPNQQTENLDTSPTERELTNEGSLSPATPPATPREEQRDGEGEGRRGVKRDTGKEDKLYSHLRDNMEKIKEFCSVMVQQIPIPEHCVIEGTLLLPAHHT